MAGYMSNYDVVDDDVNITADVNSSRRHPLDTASFLSEYLFLWANPIMKLGAERHLEVDDIYPVPSFLGSEKLFDEITDKWKRELTACKPPRLALVLLTCFWKPIMLSTISFSIFVICSVAQPFLVTSILTFVESGRVNMLGIKSGVVVAVIMGLVSLLGALGFSLGWYFINHFSLRVKTALVGLLFDKSLTISVAARQRYTTGEIMTLLSVDVEIIWNALGLVCWYWIVPIMCSVGAALLYVEVGVSAVYCIVVLLLWSYCQQQMGTSVGRLRERLVAFTAQRVNLTKEVLQGIRLVKLYAWETPAEESVASVRAKEVRLLRRYQLLKMCSTCFQFLMPVLLTFVVFATYSASGGRMSQQQTFKVLAIMNLFRLPIFAVSIMFSDGAEALKGLGRIKTYLTQPDICMIGGDSISDRCGGVGDTSGKVDTVVELGGATFSWDDVGTNTSNEGPPSIDTVQSPASDRLAECAAMSGGLTQQCSETGPGDRVVELTDTESPLHPPDISNVLSNVSLTIRRGELVAVVGSVGKGKSSLIGAILGHNTRISGSQMLAGNVAFVSQEHWIQNMSLRENILFGSAMDQKKYDAVIDAAQLRADLKALPNGDCTEIGERGINISGGQKARCAIARALYAPDIDMYVFDDPLAAVDAHVCEGIFNEAFVKFLRNKARLVVLSSNYHLLPRFDKVCVVEAGRVSVFTSHTELVDKFSHYGSYQTHSNGNVQDFGDAVLQPPKPALSDALEVTDDLLAQLCPSACSPVEDSEHLSNTRGSEGRTEEHRDECAIAMSAGTERKPPVGLLEEEVRERGKVPMSTYVKYFGAAYGSSVSPDGKSRAGVLAILGIIFLFIVGQAMRVLSDLWLGVWATDNARTHPRHNMAFYVEWYFVIIGGAVLFVFYRGYVFITSCVDSSQHLHKTMLAFLLKAPVNLYFDVTPLGRILNRVSSDMERVDSHLPDFFLQSLQNLLHCLSIVLLCIISLPYFIVLLLPIVFVFTYVQFYFRKTSREVKRLESVSRSPLYVICSEVVSGISTIRAFRQEKVFQAKHRRIMDENCRHNFMYWIVSRWISLRLEMLSNVVVFFVGLLAVLVVQGGGNVDGNLLGLTLVYSVQLTGLLQWTVRTIIVTEDSMTSVERIVAMENIKQERTALCEGDPALGTWPAAGHIVIKNLSMRYRSDLPLVLQNIDVEVPGGCKVGVVGRTGSGKSSLILALFRIVEPEEDSKIIIDGVDAMTMGLDRLRSQLTVIPQDPVMFSGSIRFNLDPFHKNSDREIWEALDRAQLKKDVLEKFPNKLNHVITENGDNLSVGQKQLMCIARALLRKSKIIVLDEATASIDSVTDQMLQKTVRTEFHNCTVLTIAHRIDTVLDYDRILVLDNGQVAEYDTPGSLLERKNGLFKLLVDKLHCPV